MAYTLPPPAPSSLPLQLKGLGMAVLPDIDPNPNNFVSAGIVSTTTVLVGCLLRLEPNKDIKVCVASCITHYPFLRCRLSCIAFLCYSVSFALNVLLLMSCSFIRCPIPLCRKDCLWTLKHSNCSKTILSTTNSAC